MTILDARMLADATEKVLRHPDENLIVDSLLDQTVHAHAHGVGLTELGRLILDERVQRKHKDALHEKSVCTRASFSSA
jgi:hypothetical protein